MAGRRRDFRGNAEARGRRGRWDSGPHGLEQGITWWGQKRKGAGQNRVGWDSAQGSFQTSPSWVGEVGIEPVVPGRT